MFRDICTFVKALWAEWQTLLTGGTPSALLVIWANATGKPIWSDVGIGFLCLTFVSAMFFSWRKQWREATTNFIQVPLPYLVGLRKNKATPLGDAIVKPYMGKRLKITGAFSDLDGAFWFQKTLQMRSDEVTVFADLPVWKSRAFLPYPRGEVITVTGTISRVTDSYITLRAVDIVSDPVPVLEAVAV